MAPVRSRRGIAAAAVALAVGGAAAASSIGVSAHSTTKKPTAPKGFSVSVFAKSTSAFWNPDSIEVAGNSVWVGYQNTTAKDGSDGKFSTVVQYSLSGRLRATYAVLGHVDGVRVNPSNGVVWVLSDEDADPHLTTIDPVAGTTRLFGMTSVNGGGGFDDIAFLGGKAFISASNPTLNSSGVNVFPAVVSATLDTVHDVVTTTPVLVSSASLNLTDPDSMYATPAGVLQLDDQGDAQLVFITGPGGAGQSVATLPIGNQMDDTIFPTSSSGTLLVSDTTKTGAVYAIKSKQWDTTRYVSSAPSDSSVAAYVGTIDPSTGVNTPLITGFANPHGEAFIPKTSH